MERTERDGDQQTPEEPSDAPDEARAVEADGTTAEEQRRGAPLDDRLDEEAPDREPGVRPRTGPLIDQTDGVVDREKDEVAEEAAEDREERSAEEAAVRTEEEPPGTTDGPDRYVEGAGEAG